MKNLLLVLWSVSLPTIWAHPQGCVAVRSITGFGSDNLFENIQPTDKWLINVNNRYFEASSTFKGKNFIADTLVTNRIYTLNISVHRLLANGWSLGITIPVSANSRNNTADHKGLGILPRYTTRSFGLGDIRLTVYKRLLPVSANKKINLQAGFGVKLPTGDYKYQDYFVRNDSTKVLAPVDQSIQLGDGGTGITAELSAAYRFSSSIYFFGNFYYLANPRVQNGVSNLKGRNPTARQINNNTTVMSVPDQFSFRGGASFQLKRLALTTALRYEKVPAKDLIGGNKGFRRAASIASFEPGLTYKLKSTSLFVSVGIPFKRNIVQNFENDETPAGFADYLVYAGISFRL
jgi:hypothetical protein